ncbi:MAG: DUF6427 family protein [Velocimicrobium sp.]
MLFIIESIILCVLFSIGILVPLAKNPVGQIMSYPVEIRRRVESLPQYKDSIKKKETRHIWIKILGAFVFVLVLAVIAYFSGATTFKEAFLHVFFLFFVVNIYDLFIMDIGIFMHCKKFWIPGTEDMIQEYHNPSHHIVGAGKGTIIGLLVAFLAAVLIQIVHIIQIG